MRVLALDLGRRRIGVAVSDPDGRLATPVTVVERGRDTPALHRRLADLVAEWEAELVVIGDPIDLAGQVGPAAQAIRAEAEELAEALGVPVELHDERMTTAIAARRLLERGDLDGRRRRQVVDMLAAAVILQGWLDQRAQPAPRTTPPEEPPS